ncbi:CHASE3 domain-containing protein [Paracraurococcus lichenis]|uniref:CHASE3 domain-containing protein n=1 Tax=Paracraurococcus lichenis TaxID=3064888 RepID=A0ABT9EA09_9PROT|nr:CHASE3 domain-containing protein [Paracraurococcus sp. LOR1-02]MDO9713034.1 CHASE3 domain-containing protein [Paracraurococcus sp. LOR1-02]
MPRLPSRSRGFALGTATALLIKGPLLAAALAWTSDAMHGLDSTRGWVEHSQAVIAEADAVLAGLSDAERSQRDFMLSQDPRALLPYQSAVLRVGTSIAALERLTAQGAPPVVPLERLWSVADRRLADLADKVQQQQAGGAAALQAEEAERGQSLMLEARNTILALRTGELQALQERLQATGQEARRALATLSLSVAVALGMLLAGAVAYRRRTRSSIDFSRIRLAMAEPGAWGRSP